MKMKRCYNETCAIYIYFLNWTHVFTEVSLFPLRYLFSEATKREDGNSIGSVTAFNPLSPKSDQYQNSPSDINAL